MRARQLNLATIPNNLASATDVIYGQTPDDGDTYSTIQLAANPPHAGRALLPGELRLPVAR